MNCYYTKWQLGLFSNWATRVALILMACVLLSTPIALAHHTGAPRAFDGNKVYTAKQARKDIRHLQKLLRTLHPNLYAHRSVKTVRKMFKDIEGEIKPTMNEIDLATLVQKTLAIACDEHTGLAGREHFDYTDYATSIYYEPFTLTPKKVLQTRTLNPKSSPQIVGLGHGDRFREFEEIYEMFRSLKSSDGCPKDALIFTPFQPALNHVLFDNYIKGEGPFRKDTLVNGETKPQTQKFTSSPALLGKKLFYGRYRDPDFALLKLGINPSLANFWSISGKGGTGIIVLHSDDSRYSYVYMREFIAGKKASAAIDKAMREVIKRNPEHVILDLTTSPGGSTSQTSRLLSYFLNRSHQIASKVYRRTKRVTVDKSFRISPRYKMKNMRLSARQFRRVKRRGGKYTLNVRRRSFGHPDYKGKLTVLVSPLTHSAATMAAIILKKQRKATIIGYQNAGSVHTSCFAAFGTYSLPVSKLKFHVPDTCFLRSGSSSKNKGPIIPDIEIDPLAQPPRDLIHAIQRAAVDHVLASSKKN